MIFIYGINNLNQGIVIALIELLVSITESGKSDEASSNRDYPPCPNQYYTHCYF